MEWLSFVAGWFPTLDARAWTILVGAALIRVYVEIRIHGFHPINSSASFLIGIFLGLSLTDGIAHRLSITEPTERDVLLVVIVTLGQIIIRSVGVMLEDTELVRGILKWFHKR